MPRPRAEGRAAFLQAMVMAGEPSDNTVFVSLPPVVQRVLSTLLGPIGRLLGYQALYPAYGEDAFWEARIEQLRR